MPTASEVICEYTSYYSCVFNLNIARPVLEGAADWTVVTILLRGLDRTTAGCPDQSTYNERSNVDSLNSQNICFRRYPR